MSSIFLDQQNKLRNGWRILIFFIIFAFSITLINAVFAILHIPQEILISEFLFLICVLIATFIMMHFFEGKNLSEVGLKISEKTKYEITFGLILGFVMITLVVIPNAIAGYYTYNFTPNQIYPQIFEALLFFVLVALAEEILFRGYPFQRLIEATNPAIATVVFSLLFASAHIFNPNVNLISLANIFLAGLWLSSAYIKANSLWLPISLHFSWNFFQGYLYSLPVSGSTLIEPVFDVQINSENLISGGDFGPEGSILTSFVLIASTIFILKNKRLGK
ncbi:CPBP family intramembrane glutamic endopeptidase [Candidatus Chrysopegis kryptomonas]|jgi:hypothetical protein|uniref:CAAX prenyl protease 2/Lysostaphin resistance protein A-like domain-containing protein n=1 Tax=Candidatus Chryseopegocella kryptomonas TaxID=1633643 RepID=A0A0N7MW57_9BACT|nr:type II CAAX endopeptidase family protein [Candidatus Chrysopegis kryptomonas]CUS97715.1 hypothetical protein JGI23_00345 [Candidatus Chrysopegis kryptomonas]